MTFDTPPAGAARPAFARWLGESNSITGQFLALGADPSRVNLAGGLPDAALYPVDEIGEAIRAAYGRHGREALNYGPVEGMHALRDYLAAQLSAKGVPATRDNVLITSGSAQALDLLGKAFIDPGDRIAVQTPTYLGALDAWRPRAPRYRPIGFNDGGAPTAEELSGCKFAYTVPNFSNPTGALVRLEQRRAALEAARETGIWLVEDDPYGVLYFDEAPLPNLLDLEKAGPGEDRQVLYLGSISKWLAPGLRIGWTVGSPGAIEALGLSKQGTDLSTSPLTQMIALEILESGLIDRHLPGLLDAYRERRAAMVAAAEAHLSDWFEWSHPEGGMFLWVVDKTGRIDTDKLLPLAIEAGVLISPSSVFHHDGAMRGGMRLNFTLNAPERIELGMARLASAVRAYLGRNEG